MQTYVYQTSPNKRRDVDVDLRRASDVWAVGFSGILHWDGSAWSQAASGTSLTFQSVWGSGAGDVWAVGRSGAILHRAP